MNLIKFLAKLWSDFKAFRIFAKFLTAVAVLALILWVILSLFVDGKTKTAPISYHEQRANNEYKARIHFENLEFLLRSRTIARVKAVNVEWANGINSSLISDIKAQNRYLVFVSKELITPNLQNLGVLSYQISFAPFIKTLLVYYVVLLLAGLAITVITLFWQVLRTPLFVLAGFYIFSLIALAFLPLPFAFVGFMAFVLCVICAFKTPNSRLKLALSYISILPLCLGIGEFYGFFKVSSNQADNQTEYPKTYWTDNNITGYGALPNVSGKTISRNKRTGEIIYDITYSTNENGWRKIPNSNANSKKCFVFFGDSFTYGEGVNDDETLPFFFGKEMKDYQIFNFGFHGYGPHQALALILSGEVERILKGKCESINALYESLNDHIKRANGFSAWEQDNKNAPKFKIKNNQVIWINASKNFKEKVNFIHKLNLTKYGKKSYLLKILDTQTYKFKQEYNELYFAVLNKIQSELKARLNADFTLFLWDASNLSDKRERREFKAILEWLESGQMQYFLMSQVASDYTQNRLKYGIHKSDLHPNALANQKIAEFLAQKIKNGEIKSHKITKKDK